MRAPTIAFVCLALPAAVRAGDEPPTLAPEVGAKLLLSDLAKEPHKPTLPKELQTPGEVFWGLYRVSIDARGAVTEVKVLRSAEVKVLHSAAVVDKGPLPPAARALDERWVATIKTWRYRPHVVNGKPAPFAYAHRVHVNGNPRFDGGKATMLAPEVAAGLLEVDVNKPPHQPTLPSSHNRPGMLAWGLYKVCVDTSGEVDHVRMIKSVDVQVDQLWMTTVRAWRYKPYVRDGQTLPFCYTLQLKVAAS